MYVYVFIYIYIYAGVHVDYKISCEISGMPGEANGSNATIDKSLTRMCLRVVARVTTVWRAACGKRVSSASYPCICLPARTVSNHT